MLKNPNIRTKSEFLAALTVLAWLLPALSELAGRRDFRVFPLHPIIGDDQRVWLAAVQ